MKLTLNELTLIREALYAGIELRLKALEEAEKDTEISEEGKEMCREVDSKIIEGMKKLNIKTNKQIEKHI